MVEELYVLCFMINDYHMVVNDELCHYEFVPFQESNFEYRRKVGWENTPYGEVCMVKDTISYLGLFLCMLHSR